MKIKSLVAVLAILIGMPQPILAGKIFEKKNHQEKHRKDHQTKKKSCEQTWPRWGLNNENTFANLEEKRIGVENVAHLRQLWNFQLPEDDYYQVEPIVVDGLMYLLSGTGYLYVVNTKFGTLSPEFNGGQRLFVGSKNDANAGSTPVVFGKYIYTATDDLVVRSFNRFTGAKNPHWPIQGVTVPVYPYTAEASVQAVLQTSLCILEDGKDSLLFISTSSVDEITTIPLQKGTQNAYDLNGNLIWSEVVACANNDAMGVGCWSTPSFDTKNKLMFFGTSNPQLPPAGEFSDALQARNYLTGKLIWNYQFVANDVSSVVYPYGIGNPIYLVDKDIGASPNVFDVTSKGKTKHLVGVNGKDFIYRAFDRATGELAWVNILTNTPAITGNPSAAYANGILYAVGISDILPASTIPNPPFSPFFGNEYPTPACVYADLIAAETEGEFEGLVRFFQGLLTGNGIVTAIDAATGETLWSRFFPSFVYGAPVYANGVLYVGSYDGTLRALNACNGAVLATFKTPLATIPPGFPIPLPENETIPTAVSVVNGVVYLPYENAVLSGNAGVIALGL